LEIFKSFCFFVIIKMIESLNNANAPEQFF
jgi:hypothetical protein